VVIGFVGIAPWEIGVSSRLEQVVAPGPLLGIIVENVEFSVKRIQFPRIERLEIKNVREGDQRVRTVWHIRYASFKSI
jgi:hypothetical protein